MSRYHGDLRAGQKIVLPFDTNDANGAPATLASPSVKVRKNGVDLTTPGGITINADIDGAGSGSNELIIDTSIDTTNFVAGADYTVRLAGSSAVGATSAVGQYVGSFSIGNRSVAVDANGKVTAGTIGDKAGYSLSQGFPANFAALGITAGGKVSEVALCDAATSVTGPVTVGTLPTPTPTGYGGPSISPAQGTVQASPTPTGSTFAISGVATGTTPASGAWAGQMAFRPATGERRFILSHAVAGSGQSAVHTLTFGTSSGLSGPFASAPAAGESIEVA